MFGLPLMFYTIPPTVGAANVWTADQTFLAKVGIGAAPSGAFLHMTEDSSVADFVKFQDTRATHTRTWFMGPGTGLNDTFTLRDSTGSVNVMSFAFGGAASYAVKAVASTAETLSTYTVSDDAVAALKFFNFTATDAGFLPAIEGKSAGSSYGLILQARKLNDSGSNAAMVFNTLTNGGAAFTVPPLYEWQNNGTAVIQMLPLSIGNSACLAWTTANVAAPTFTNRSVGTKIVLYPQVNASNVDAAIGIETGGVWFSILQAIAGDQFRWYGGTTALMRLQGDGHLDLTTGGLRIGGNTIVSVGPALELLMANPNGSINSYDRSASAWKNLAIQSAATTFAISGTTVFTISATGLASTVPIGVPSYTVAGVPSAALAAQIIYVSNESGGAVLAFSDGTNWRRVTDRAIIS